MKVLIVSILAILASALIAETGLAHNKRGPFNIDTSIRGASHIVLAQVVDISYAMSKGDGGGEVLPHTFVTFQILKVLKGNPRQANDKITLRFLGGRGEQSTFLQPANYPLFDIGDQDVLFLRGNLQKTCPLVNCGQGRFRSIQGVVYDDKGHEVVLTRKQAVAFGKHHDLPDVMTHKVSQTTIYLKDEGRSSEGPEEPDLPVGIQFKTDAFVNYLDVKIKRAWPPDVLDKWPKIPDADPRTPFTVKPLREFVGKRMMPLPWRPVTPPSEADKLEQQRYDQNQGNPVIPK